MIRSLNPSGIKGRTRDGVDYAIFWSQIRGVVPKVSGCRVYLDTGEYLMMQEHYNEWCAMLNKFKTEEGA